MSDDVKPLTKNRHTGSLCSGEGSYQFCFYD